jgi:UDP-glucose 4-epimerase
MSILVIGGAGYIGAHVVRLLQERGEDVVVVDDLSTGTPDRIGTSTLVELDVASEGAEELLVRAMTEHVVTAVIHFAARKQVGESVERPEWYYLQNVGGMAKVLSAMRETGVAEFIFSSSAAVYGMPEEELISEDTRCEPINPYGQTKLIGEWMLANAEKAWGLKWNALRYFNVAGSGWADLGDPAILNLIPMVLDRLARGDRPKIFGDDYPTPDGTCIRDYIHVLDLARAHLAAMDNMGGPGGLDHHVFNVGTGTGYSVREVIEAVGEASGLDSTPDVVARRAGDPPKLIASPDRINSELGWTARNGLKEIVESAWEAWQAGPRRIG